MRNEFDAARARENWLLFSVIARPPCETVPKSSMDYFLAFWLKPDGDGRWQVAGAEGTERWL